MNDEENTTLKVIQVHYSKYCSNEYIMTSGYDFKKCVH
jgi:hypothetical protein